MVKQYVLVSNEQRQMLIQLIHTHGHSISRAAKVVNIYYPTAKAINKVYVRENRVQKKTFRSTIQNCVEPTPHFALEKRMVRSKTILRDLSEAQEYYPAAPFSQ